LKLGELAEKLFFAGIETEVLYFGECLTKLFLVEDVAVLVVEELLVEKGEILVSLLGDELEDVLSDGVELGLDSLLFFFDVLGDGFDILSLLGKNFKVFFGSLVIFHAFLTVLLVVFGSDFDELIERLELAAEGIWIVDVEEALDTVEFFLASELRVDTHDGLSGMKSTTD
jgi:hypothetical protein